MASLTLDQVERLYRRGLRERNARYVKHDPTIPPPVEGLPAPAVIDQLRRDRDELLAALERSHGEGLHMRFHQIDEPDCTACALVARIKAGK